jgi:hypothetical protein
MSIEEDEEAGRIHLVAYRMMAESSEKTQDRRQAANNFFIVLNAALCGGYAFMVKEGYSNLYGFGSGLGAVICALWCLTLMYYRELNSAKYQLLGEYEVEKGIAGYQREWELFVANGIFGRVKIGKWRLSLSSIELAVAFFALVAHLAAPTLLTKVEKQDKQNAAGMSSAAPVASAAPASQNKP